MPPEKKKILIAEDEPSLSEMYKLYFERAGYEVFHVQNGQECFEAAKEKNPDIILLDILMPKVNGWEVLENLKRDVTTKSIPIFIFSNLAQSGEIEKGLELGADEYLIKSDLTPKELLARIENKIK